MNHLNAEASHWKETVTEKRAVALGLQNSIQAYQNYLNQVRQNFSSCFLPLPSSRLFLQLNSTLEKQLNQYQGQLEGDDSDYGVLDRLKTEFGETLNKERDLAARMRSQYERQISHMQREHTDAMADTQARLQQLESDRAQIEERQVRELHAAKRHEEAAKDGQAAAQVARDDAQALYVDLQRQQKSLGLANERLREKLQALQEKHQREVEGRAGSMEQWQRELREASENQAAALRRAETAEGRVMALEARMGDLEQLNRSLDVSMSDARSDKEEFLYSIQKANERLKEKLRLTLEDRAAIAAELKHFESLQSTLEKTRINSDQLNRRIQSLESELERAARYKEDWMSEVKKRASIEDRGHTEAITLRAQLDQLRLQLSELNSSNVSLHENQIRLANAESRVQELDAHVKRLERSLVDAEHRNGSLETELNQSRGESARLGTEMDKVAEALRTARSQLVSLSNVGSELSRLESRYATLEKKLRTENSRCSSYERANVQLEKELAAYRVSSSSGMQERVQELLNASGSMAEQLDSASSTREALTVQLQAARSEIVSLRAEAGTLELEAKESAETAKAWKLRFEKSKAAMEKSEDELRSMANIAADESAQKEAIQNRLVALEKERGSEAEQLRKFQARVAALEASLELASAKVTEMQAELSRATDAFADTGADVSFGAWCAALKSAQEGNKEAVKRYLNSPRQAGELDYLIRAVLQKTLELEEAPKPAAPSSSSAVVGGDSPQVIANNLKLMLEDRAGVLFSVFKVVHVAPQAHPYGRTLFIKIDVGEGEAVWIRVFETNGAPPICNCAQGPKNIREDMIFFDEWELTFSEQATSFVKFKGNDFEAEEENDEEEEEIEDDMDEDDMDEDDEGRVLPPLIRVEEEIETVEKKKRRKKMEEDDEGDLVVVVEDVDQEKDQDAHVYNLRTESERHKRGRKSGSEDEEDEGEEDHHYSLRSYDKEDDEADQGDEGEEEDGDGEGGEEEGEHHYNLRSYDSSAERPSPVADKPKRRQTQPKAVSKGSPKAKSSPYELRSARKKRK